jgi:hypothetical protein
MNGASWADEIRPSASRTDQADATSNNNYFGEYSSLDVATGTLSNNGTQPPSTSHIKKSPIKLVQAGDEPKNPDALFCPIIEGDEANTFNDEYPENQKTSANSKRTVTPDNISQNDTSHHVPKRLKKSDESKPGDKNRTHHSTVVPCRGNQSSSLSSTFYPHLGQRTGAKRASNWYSTRTQKSNSNLHFFVHTLFCPATTTVPTFTFLPENGIGVSALVRSTY